LCGHKAEKGDKDGEVIQVQQILKNILVFLTAQFRLAKDQ
jgi:hypothetical protein